MVEEVNKGNRTTTTFCKTGWKNIKQGLKDKFTKEWDDNQLKNKYNQLRQRHKNCKSILGETGMGFTAATGKLDAPEDVWKKKQRLPCRTSEKRGHDWIQEPLNGNPSRIYDCLRMDKSTFLRFCKELKEHGGLTSSRNVIIEEQVAIFLRAITHMEDSRDNAEIFQHSTATISKYFTIILKAVNRFAKMVIRPPNFHEVPTRISENIKFYPYFKVYFYIYLYFT
ncbi:hypothetical protein LINGRAHAP2_LOCUS10019 [Linum grandiflorum]